LISESGVNLIGISKAMRNVMKLRLIIFFPALLLFQFSMAQWCDCMPKQTTEEEYKRSDLVIQGRIIAFDTIYSSNALINDHKGIKLGKHKYRIEIEKFARLRVVVEKTFKSSVKVADTIYILTPADCPVLNTSLGILAEQYTDFIVYADKWIENKIITIKKGNRRVKQIEQILIVNTFLTDRCRRTDLTTNAELANLETLRP
jgi:hypothetical protein